MSLKSNGIRVAALAAGMGLMACSFVRHSSYTVQGESSQILMLTPQIQVNMAGISKENHYPFSVSPVRQGSHYRLTLNIVAKQDFIIDSLYIALAEADSLGGKIKEVKPNKVRTEIANAFDCETVVHEGLIDARGNTQSRMGGIDAPKYVANFPGMKKFNLFTCLQSGESTVRAPKVTVTYEFGKIQSETAVLSALVWMSVGGKPTFYAEDFVLHKKVDWNLEGVMASN